ncbi:amidohydrolase [Vulgatibacter sp.]|uniref:amidohydrolase n=1 Tax=Vulgatibacter sp. TaxID=1971226 RepID=UPI003562215B
MLLCNARVITQDENRPVAEAVAIAKGRIVAVGTESECAPHADGERIDLGGAVVLPGLTDAHAHVLGLGIFLAEVDLTGSASEPEVVERVARVAGQGAGWLRGFGWDQSRWPGGAFPHQRSLSAAVPGRPVWLTRIDGHAAWANGEALRLAGIDGATADPPGGRIVRDGSGAPTGVLVDTAMELVARCIPPFTEAEREARILAACAACARVGLTGVHDAGDDAATLATLQRLDAQGRLPLRIYAMVDGGKAHTFEPWRERGPWQGENLAIRCVKLLLDGALGSRGAAFHEPYADEPGNRGLTLFAPARFRELLRQSHEAGFQLAVHAIGDRANTDVLDGFAAVGLRAADRPRLEHAQILRPADVSRAAGLGVIASMQPTHCTSDMPWVEARIGRGRMEGAYAWRSFLDAGACLALGSDFPIESPDPRKGLYAAITRQDERGHPPGGFHPHERISAAEALRGFTTGAAFAAFAEGELGRIAPGYRADLTVLDRDPLAVEPRAILDAAVLLSVVAGRVIHDGR